MDEIQCTNCHSDDVRLIPTMSGPRKYKCNGCGISFLVTVINPVTLREGATDVREFNKD